MRTGGGRELSNPFQPRCADDHVGLLRGVVRNVDAQLKDMASS
jgi:hypothetical protein